MRAKIILLGRFARYNLGDSWKKASEATLMYGWRHRLMQPRPMFRAALSSVALAACLTLFALTPQASAAHPARAGDSVTLTFTVKVQAGTPPSDVLFWFCADAQADGTGCEEMTAQADGTFTYQFATTTGTTYQRVTIEWSHGRLPTDKGPIPAPPVHLACDYQHPFNVSATDRSYTCNTDFTVSTVTPVPSATTATPSPAASTGPASGSGGDNSTLVTGLQIIIGVGLFLFVLLLIILIWQRVSAHRP
jgi:hypothetical protein